MKPRGPWQGMINIVRFNWPFYATAALICVLASALAWWSEGLLYRFGAVSIFASAAVLSLGSLGVSHLIYDRSDLYRWGWLDRALRSTRRDRAIFCHTGFDETSTDLRARLAGTEWLLLDHFDRDRMTEASIRRARSAYPPTSGTAPATFDHWPIETESIDLVFGLLAIHELRTHEERAAWFAEARRCLRPHGRVVLVEHVRDLANFLAFGPGFLHFHTAASWRRAWEAGGCRLTEEFCVTPWVRVFVLARL